ncbi:MAG: nucleotidyltransferase domain-containing protein, partial [Oscillospiraceae bacterium]|nr:nucleotidyltransferase domain-containing protein [Oscillospiraceae bacterium]
MLFSELADAELDGEIKSVVHDLVSLKMQTSELGESGHIVQLTEYIEQNLASVKSEIESLPSEHKAGWDNLNELFVRI